MEDILSSLAWPSLARPAAAALIACLTWIMDGRNMRMRYADIATIRTARRRSCETIIVYIIVPIKEYIDFYVTL